jgi:excisionase family DNA binding protein
MLYLNEENLRKIIFECVVAALQGQPKDNDTAPGTVRPHLTVKEASYYINLSVAFIYKHVHEDSPHPIPHIKAGKKILFIKEELDAWLRSYRP